MDTRFTLSQIVDSVLRNGGSIKTAAADVCEKCGKPAMADSKMCRDCAEQDARKSDDEDSGPGNIGEEKTSSERVVKLASAVEYIVHNPELIHPVLGRIKVASPPQVTATGPGKGPNPMATNLMAATPGEQSDVTGEAKTKVPMRNTTKKAIPGDKQPDNAMEDNLRELKGPYPEEGPLKEASVWGRRGTIDAAKSLALGSPKASATRALQKKIKGIPDVTPDWTRSARPRPFGGEKRILHEPSALDKPMEGIDRIARGQASRSGRYSGPMSILKNKPKTASFRERYISVLRKRAADAENPASIASAKSTALPEDQPDKVKRPAEVKSQEKLVGSNQAAIDVTKRQAKAVPKKRIAEVLSEPAQTRATDKILDENLGKKVVDQAGAKVASARALLKKVASEGCSCGEDGTCGHCKVAARLKQQQNGQ